MTTWKALAERDEALAQLEKLEEMRTIFQAMRHPVYLVDWFVIVAFIILVPAISFCCVMAVVVAFQ